MGAPRSPGRNASPAERTSGGQFGLSSSIAVIIVVVLFGELARASAGWTSGELAVLQSVSLLHTPGLDAIALGINWLFSPSVAALVLVVVAIATLIVTRSARTVTRLLVLTTLAWLGSDLIKHLVQRPRPDIASLAHVLIAHPAGFSFPSGHTAFASSLALSLVVIARDRRVRRVLAVSGAMIAIFTGVSRVYLGVHYPTDVIGSLVYSIAAVLMLDTLWRRFVLPRWPSGN